MASWARSTAGRGRHDRGAVPGRARRGRATPRRTGPGRWPRPNRRAPARRTCRSRARAPHRATADAPLPGEHVAQGSGRCPGHLASSRSQQVTRSSGAPSSATRSQLKAPSAMAPPLPSASATGQGDQLSDAEHHRADRQREPRGLHALGDGVGPPPGSVQPGGAGGRAVRQEVELAGDLREQHGGHREPGQRHRSEPADDGRVDEEVASGSAASTGSAGPGQPQDLPRREGRRRISRGWACGTRRRTRAACCARRPARWRADPSSNRVRRACGGNGARRAAPGRARTRRW